MCLYFVFFFSHCIIATQWGEPDVIEGLKPNPSVPIILQCVDPVGWVI